MQGIFLILQDFRTYIQDAIKDDLLTDDADRITRAIPQGIEEMMADLRVRFDVSNIFPAQQRWYATRYYRKDDYVHLDGVNYRALLTKSPDTVAPREPIDPDEVDGLNYNLDPSDADNSDWWTSECFPFIKEWNNADTWVAGAYVVDSHVDGTDTVYQFYRALNDNVDLKPADNPSDWEVDDPRQPIIVRYACAVILYLAHLNKNPNQIPQLRVDEYDLYKKWAKEVASGAKEPYLPLLPATTNDKTSIGYGNSTGRGYRY